MNTNYSRTTTDHTDCLEQQSRNQTVQGVFPADDADETDGARTLKRGGRKDRGADGGLASFLSAGSAISALKSSWLLFPEIHPRPSALPADNCWGEFCLGSKILRNCDTDSNQSTSICHSERSEESITMCGNGRAAGSFASLRMTGIASSVPIRVIRGQTHIHD